MAQARPRKRGAAPAKKRKRVQIPDDQIRYTNVDMLKRFLSERGKIRARRMTGLSRRQQALAAREIKRAREIGLLPYILPKTDRPRGGGSREDRGDRGDRGDRAPREERAERPAATSAAA